MLKADQTWCSINCLVAMVFLASSLAFGSGSTSVILLGDYEENLYESDFSIGVSPEYCIKLSGNRDLCISLPVRWWGDLIYRTDYFQQTHYFSLGVDGVLYYPPIFANKWFSIRTGPEAFANYGFRPSTYVRSGDSTTREDHPQYLIGSLGAACSVRADFCLSKHWSLRLTDRLLRISADSHFDKGYSDSVDIKVGLEQALSPSASLVFTF